MFGQGSETLGQFHIAFVGQDLGGHEFHLLVVDALALIASVLVALQHVVGALDNGLAVALNSIGLGADMAADHVVDASHFLEEVSSLLLQTGKSHVL